MHIMTVTILILFQNIVCNAPCARAAAWDDSIGTAAPPAANGRAARTTHVTSATDGTAEAVSPKETADKATAGAIPRRNKRCRNRCRAEDNRDSTVPRGQPS